MGSRRGRETEKPAAPIVRVLGEWGEQEKKGGHPTSPPGQVHRRLRHSQCKVTTTRGARAGFLARADLIPGTAASAPLFPRSVKWR